MSEKKIAVETYTLVLKHSIWDGEKTYELEEPLIIQTAAELALEKPIYVLNEMMDKLKYEVLNRYAR